MRWRIAIEVWPHSTGKGQEADQKAAGDRTHYFYVEAEDIYHVIKLAGCFAQGILVNPAVWQAPITGVNRIRDDGD